MYAVEFLIISPLLFAVVVLFGNIKVKYIVSIVFVLLLSFFAMMQFLSDRVVSFSLPHSFHQAFIVVDTVLLTYFLYQGFKQKDLKVFVLALVQIVLYFFVISLVPNENINDILVDHISSFMYLIINIVGGIIIIYAIKYIQSEEFSRFKKNLFIATLFLFLSVMNLIVSTNNIELFFLAFELTTLFSYILIQYRKDDLSIVNSLRALWMNQIGGVAILLSLLFSIYEYQTVYFSILLKNIDPAYLLPIALLVIAAFVKAATIPFNSWLLGAMVAPTPVSAMLHSATMVKISPYLILKISPSFSEYLSIAVSLFGGFVFLTATLLALSKDYFKEILGLSTIALLALMISLAAINTPESIQACMMLIFFHAVSKALLFLQAGVLEKVYHIKYIDKIDNFSQTAPWTLFFILMGFISLTLPPFGAFIGKFLAIQAISAQIQSNPLNIVLLLFVASGSVVLTLLYFKIVTKLFAKDANKYSFDKEVLPKTYFFTSLSLVFILIIGLFVVFNFTLFSTFSIIVPALLILIVPFLFYAFKIRNADRVKEYHCGEKDEFQVAVYYFGINKKYQNLIMAISIAALCLIIFGGVK